jgi:hypothetical protein
MSNWPFVPKPPLFPFPLPPATPAPPVPNAGPHSKV